MRNENMVNGPGNRRPTALNDYSRRANGKTTSRQRPVASVANIRSPPGKAIDLRSLISFMPFMPTICFIRSLVVAVGLLMAPLTLAQVGAQAPGQSPTQSSPAPESIAAAKGVQCPAGHESAFDATTKVLRCRHDVVSWVVTSCPDKDFATYAAKPGVDTCGRTEIPGVGTPPGATGSRAVSCAAPGYTVVVDRTGPRDRCERIERSFALPRSVP